MVYTYTHGCEIHNFETLNEEMCLLLFHFIMTSFYTYQYTDLYKDIT
jgi:hypothetical protein